MDSGRKGNSIFDSLARAGIAVNITDTFDESWRKDAVPLDQMISDKFAPVSELAGYSLYTRKLQMAGCCLLDSLRSVLVRG